jgi:hypothetical protein
MSNEVTFLGNFPFCVNYQAGFWDGTTYYNGSPSNDSGKQTPVIGDGTGWVGPLTLIQATQLFWKAKSYKITSASASATASSSGSMSPSGTGSVSQTISLSAPTDITPSWGAISYTRELVCANGLRISGQSSTNSYYDSYGIPNPQIWPYLGGIISLNCQIEFDFDPNAEVRATLNGITQQYEYYVCAICSFQSSAEAEWSFYELDSPPMERYSEIYNVNIVKPQGIQFQCSSDMTEGVPNTLTTEPYSEYYIGESKSYTWNGRFVYYLSNWYTDGFDNYTQNSSRITQSLTIPVYGATLTVPLYGYHTTTTTAATYSVPPYSGTISAGSAISDVVVALNTQYN